MRENSNMVLFPEYKKAKEQHKNHNMPRRSDLNQARNVIKEFEHPSIQGRTMYSSVIGGSNEEGTWRSTDSAANTDGPATMSDLHSLIQAFISFKKAELKIEEYHIFWNSRKLQPHQEKLLQSPVYLKISRNNLLSTGPYLSMRENSNMMLFPEYKKAKEQHKNHNMPRRSDLNQARNVIKEFEHPSIQGRTMYSSVVGGSNEEGTWRIFPLIQENTKKRHTPVLLEQIEVAVKYLKLSLFHV
ncbi:hypothetical protein F2Q68_00042414 [Brassica cretica]|uniref:Uncharacterized protein n=1 Tax=Brassica cretica TaxID=69181 RepID=A0A8S9MJR6_BRACR|nr:hypothetical protein F2Q68_00042414 [Brassica cretica]